MNHPLLKALHSPHIEAVLQRVDRAEVDEMWSFVGKKKRPRWLWHALDHRSGKDYGNDSVVFRCRSYRL